MTSLLVGLAHHLEEVEDLERRHMALFITTSNKTLARYLRRSSTVPSWLICFDFKKELGEIGRTPLPPQPC